MTTLADLIDEVVNGRGPTYAPARPFRSPLASAVANDRQTLPQAAQALRANMSAAKAAAAAPAMTPLGQIDANSIAAQLHPEYNLPQQVASMVLDPTGLPQLGRGVGHTLRSIQLRDQPQASADEAGAAIPEIAMGGLNLMGTLGVLPRGARELPQRLPVAEPVTPLPINPTRELGPNALPIRPPEPFRNSLRGGSADLSEAAAIRRGNDGGHVSEMPVSELRSRIDPFGAVNPWDEDMAPITIEEVRQAMRAGASERATFSHGSPQRDWTRQDHINRIATLALEGSTDPVRMTRLGGINDGMHRLAAAIVRGDQNLPVSEAQVGALGFGDGPQPLNPTSMQRNGGRWEIVDENGGVLERLPQRATIDDAGARLRHWRSVRPGAAEPPHWSAPRGNNVGQSLERMPLSALEHYDPIEGARPWETRGAPIEDETVRAALANGRFRNEPFNDAPNWTGQDHAERIASLVRNGWEDPITLGRGADGEPYVIDGYHRLAAARLRGDRDIAVRYGSAFDPLPSRAPHSAGQSFDLNARSIDPAVSGPEEALRQAFDRIGIARPRNVTLPTRQISAAELPDYGPSWRDRDKVTHYQDLAGQSEPPPIIVARDARNGQWDVLDGNHRLEVMRRAGRTDIPVVDATEAFGGRYVSSEARPPQPAGARQWNSTGHSLIPLGIGLSAGLEELPRRRTNNNRDTSPAARRGSFLGAY